MARSIRDLILRAVDDGYPPAIHIPHSFIAVAKYREWRTSEGEPVQWLYDFVMSFFSHSQGSGAWAMSLIKGLSISSYCAEADYSHFHLLAYLLTYWSPRDLVYRILCTPRHPLRLYCIGMDALDGITTVASYADLAHELHPRNKILPVLSGVVSYNMGSIFQYLDCKARGKNPGKTFLAEPGSDVTRGALLACSYVYFARVFRQGRYRNQMLVVLSLLEVFIEIVEDILDFDAYEHIHKLVLPTLKVLRRSFALGPPALQDAADKV